MKITIGHLYPDLLNLYGDRGNIQCLMKRCQWRGIEAETIPFELDDKIDFSKLDIVLLGGGSDREQMIVCEKLQEIQPDFKAYVEDNGVVIAICGGYQLLGKYYKTDQGNMKGLDLVDLYTEQGEGRLIQNIVLQSELFDMPIVGFENHGGRTCINNNKPLGKVLYGAGNDGKSGYEGVVYKNVIGTYLHGPLLPKNPQLADWLIQHALERKYGKETNHVIKKEKYCICRKCCLRQPAKSLSPCRRFWQNWKNRGFELSERVFMMIWKPCVILEWIYITEEDGKEDIMRKNPLQIKQKRIIR